MSQIAADFFCTEEERDLLLPVPKCSHETRMDRLDCSGRKQMKYVNR